MSTPKKAQDVFPYLKKSSPIDATTIHTAPVIDTNTTPRADDNENIALMYKKICKIEKSQENLAKNQKMIMRSLILLRKESKLNSISPSNNNKKIKDFTLPLKNFAEFEKLNKTLNTNLEARQILVILIVYQIRLFIIHFKLL